jgi:hypothetical protein
MSIGLYTFGIPSLTALLCGTSNDLLGSNIVDSIFAGLTIARRRGQQQVRCRLDTDMNRGCSDCFARSLFCKFPHFHLTFCLG